jgi:hypothetical protein
MGGMEKGRPPVRWGGYRSSWTAPRRKSKKYLLPTLRISPARAELEAGGQVYEDLPLLSHPQYYPPRLLHLLGRIMTPPRAALDAALRMWRYAARASGDGSRRSPRTHVNYVVLPGKG